MLFFEDVVPFIAVCKVVATLVAKVGKTGIPVIA